MSEKLIVKIPLKYPQQDIDTDAVENMIIEHQHEFEPLFERSIDIDDGRVQLASGSMEVEHIELEDDGQSGIADVEFMSSFYAGCKDMNSDDWHQESLPFQIIDGVLVFEIDLPMRWRVDN